MTELQQRVHAIVAKVAKISVGDLGLDSDLRTEFFIDSLVALRIVAAIETEFDIELEEDQMDIHSTVRGIAEALATQCGQGVTP